MSETDFEGDALAPIGDFSEQASAYKDSRPSYPTSLVDQLVDEAALSPGDPVVEFGAGTGIFTQMLVERGFAVTAIEPNDRMRAQATIPQARWLDATFESSRLPDQSQRWAVAAQAFHWADPKQCLPEIRRILQPGCVFTVLWNDRANQDSAILGWTEDAIRRIVPEFDEAYRDWPWHEVLESSGDFTFLQRRKVRHIVRMSKSRYLNLWRSHNRLNNTAGSERFEMFFAELLSELDQRNVEFVDVPYDCQAWSARRVER